MAAWPVRRPTEDAAVYAVSRSPRPLPPITVLADLLIVARAIGDRHGEQRFDRMLDRKLRGA
ncbi:hypothetical protein OG937_24435 [Streptomyces sp. NBC_00510]